MIVCVCVCVCVRERERERERERDSTALCGVVCVWWGAGGVEGVGGEYRGPAEMGRRKVVTIRAACMLRVQLIERGPAPRVRQQWR